MIYEGDFRVSSGCRFSGFGNTRYGLVAPRLSASSFLFDREKDILVLPVHLVGDTISRTGQDYMAVRKVWGGAYVFAVNPYRGFSLKGKVMHYDEHTGNQAPVKRALSIENTLYTISPDVIYMSDIANDVGYINNVRLE
jgi:hypothetical protein